LGQLQPDNLRAHGLSYGFFNGIPSGNAMIITNSPVVNVNLVSTRWHDWKNFTLNKCAPQTIPRLALPSGENVKCLGYIMGRWANEEDIGHQWTGIKVFVVDVTLGDDRSDQTYNFILTRQSLKPTNAYDRESSSTPYHYIGTLTLLCQ
jgi:hypothetical protein